MKLAQGRIASRPDRGDFHWADGAQIEAGRQYSPEQAAHSVGAGKHQPIELLLLQTRDGGIDLRPIIRRCDVDRWLQENLGAGNFKLLEQFVASGHFRARDDDSLTDQRTLGKPIEMRVSL